MKLRDFVIKGISFIIAQCHKKHEQHKHELHLPIDQENMILKLVPDMGPQCVGLFRDGNEDEEREKLKPTKQAPIQEEMGIFSWFTKAPHGDYITMQSLWVKITRPLGPHVGPKEVWNFIFLFHFM